MKLAGAVLALALASSLQAEILDRTVAVVGTRPITASEVEAQLQLEAMFNNGAVDLSEPARQAALERLVEQRLIETDMTLAGLQLVADSELDAASTQLREDGFGGLGFTVALGRYGLKDKDVREFLRKQLRFTHYVQFRFRAGLQADEEAIRAAYLRKFAGAEGAPAMADVHDQIREELLNERAETMLDERVRQLRAETRIVFLDPIERMPEVEP